MKTATVAIALAVGALWFLAGCAATYQRSCQIRLDSDPPGAEIWKGRYYVGTTPLVLHYTATSADAERGYLRVPPHTIRKDGYRPFLVEMDLDLKKSGNFWEARAVLEPED